MTDYKFDYCRNSFYIETNEDGKRYFLMVKNEYVEVSEAVFKVCRNSYNKIRNTYNNEVARSIISYEDIDSATFFVAEKDEHTSLEEKIHIKDLANKAVKVIDELPEKNRNIATCIFLRQMTIKETSELLGIPATTIFNRKKKIQQKIQNILKKME